VLTLATDLSDLGMNAGLIRFASLYLHRGERAKAGAIFNVALRIRLVASGLAFAGVFLLAPSIAGHLLGEAALVTPLRIAICGVLGALLFGLASAMLQAEQAFGKLVTANTAQGLIRLLALGALLLVGAFRVNTVLGVYVVAPLLAFALAVALLPPGLLRRFAWDPSLARELTSFSKWITLSILCVTVYNRLDVFMLTRLTDSEQVGVYSSAYRLAFLFPFITGALTTVLFPKVSALSDPRDVQRYLRRVLYAAGIVVMVLPPALLLAAPLVTTIFGSDYAAAVPIFRILALGFSISIIVNPVGLAFYALGRPELLALLNALQLVFLFPANLWLIPRFGGSGAAWASTGGRMLSVAFFALFVPHALRSAARAQSSDARPRAG